MSMSLTWYSFYGAIACGGIGYQVAFTGTKAAAAKGEKLKRQYAQCSTLMMVVWVGYGVAWGLSEGGNVISPAREAVFYGILDLVGGPIFGTLVAMAAR